MIKNLIVIVLILFSFVAKSQEYIFKFKVDSREELSKLTRVISIDNVENGIVTAYANADELKEFKKFGYDFKFIPRASEGKLLTMATTVAEMANWDKYPTYDVYVQMMNDFATNYPNLCKLETIGTSVDGRAILSLKISDNVNTNEAEPQFFYTGQMHGDEIVAYIMFLKLADHLLSNYGTDSQVTNLVNNIEIYINPLSNPDGTYKGGNNTVSGASRLNAHNVDLNRNFPTPNYQNPQYVNEFEIQAMMNFADAHHFVMSANTHSGAELVNYPWDSWYSSDNKHADHNWFEKVSYNYADTVHANSMSSDPPYFFGQGDGVTHGADWYLVDGSRQDYMTYFKNCREVTLELSNEKALDASLLPAHWNYNRSAFLGYIEECLYGFKGTVTDVNTGNPLNAKIEILAHDKDNSFVVTNPTFGNYYRPIEPGTYDVTYSAEGYIPQTHTITVNDYISTIIKDVQLGEAPKVNVTGTVTDYDTGNPIQNAKIEFSDTTIPAIYTDILGEYSAPNIYEETYNINASALEYSSQTKIENISTTNKVINFQLVKTTGINFENEMPSDFTFSGNAPWIRSSDKAYEGTWSAKSGTVSDDESSSMQITKNVTDGDISFYKFVSCEDGAGDKFDYLEFFIDDISQAWWDGVDTEWSQAIYPVTAGTRTFKWLFAKDENASGGDDCAWVDFIEIPVDDSAEITNKNNFTISIYPNPTSENIQFAYNKTIKEIKIYDITGKLVGSYEVYNHSKIISIQNKGIYIAKITTENKTFYKKIIVE